MISKGHLSAAENAGAVANGSGNIFFRWVDNTGTGTAKATDKVILLAYFADTQQIIYSMQTAKREDCQTVLITNAMTGYTAQTWIRFLSDEEKDAANNVYTRIVILKKPLL